MLFDGSISLLPSLSLMHPAPKQRWDIKNTGDTPHFIPENSSWHLHKHVRDIVPSPHNHKAFNQVSVGGFLNQVSILLQ